MGIFAKIFRGIENTRVYGREYSKRSPYSISFEDTKIKWYKGRLVNAYMKTAGKDLFFFTDPKMKEKEGNWGAALYTYLMDEIPNPPKRDSDVNIFFISLIKLFHEREGQEWTADSGSIRNLPNKNFFTLEVVGKINSELKDDYTTYDFLVISNSKTVLLSALMPKNPKPEVIRDLKTIANSFKI